MNEKNINSSEWDKIAEIILISKYYWNYKKEQMVLLSEDG